MRERRTTLLTTVLVLAFVALLVAPLAASASSGLPSTVTMYPETAGPGTTVELTGLDFPGDAIVELELTTADGTIPLTTVRTATGGHFRSVMSLPVTATEGAWQLRAVGPDGSTATYAFTTSVGIAPVVVDPATPASAGNSMSDSVVMLVIALVLGGVAIGGMFAYRMIRDDGPQTGMGEAADLIWSGTGKDATPELTATEEPHWKAAQSET
jgi:hypothetical protein